jgi:hypothetical protein
VAKVLRDRIGKEIAMSEGNMPEDWIGETVEAFPDSENLVVRGSLLFV